MLQINLAIVNEGLTLYENSAKQNIELAKKNMESLPTTNIDNQQWYV